MVLCSALIMSACKKQWDQRDKVTSQQFNVTLMQQIKANPNLTTFARILAKGGYDKMLSSSKNFTVWAPVNAAFQGVDTSFTALTTHDDSVKYKTFVGNHIVNQTYLTTDIQSSMRVRALNGKNITITSTTVEGVNITTADQYVGNGVLNVIDEVLLPKMNIDEYITNLSMSGVTFQKAYVRGQDSSYVDTSKATVASIDPVTGKPKLVPNTGVVKLNKYYNKVGNLASEDSTYTYIILNDAAYTNETNKVKPFFVTSSVDTTARLAAYNVLKDVVIKGKIALANLNNPSLKSVMGKPVPINSNNVVSSYEASNGMVYVVNSLNFNIKNKIDTITIQGEQPSFYMRTDQAGTAGGITTPKTIFLGFKEPDGTAGHELFIRNTGIKQFYSAYTLNNLNTCQYKVIYRAYSDTSFSHVPTAPTNPDGSGVISERIAFGATTGVTVGADGTRNAALIVTYPYFKILPYNTANPNPAAIAETEATGATSTGTNQTINAVSGRLNVVRRRSVNMYVQGANVTTTNLNNILIDYIKLIPITQ